MWFWWAWPLACERIEDQYLRSQVCWLATPALGEPLGQSVVYWAENRALRCTKAVAAGLTRLTAPPRASKAMPPEPFLTPATFWKATTPASRVLIPALLSGVVKKSDLVYWGCRVSLPPLAYAGRWQAW